MKKQKNQFCTSLAFVLVMLGTSSFVTAQPLTPKEQAERILQISNVKGGLIVHIGCGDGLLTAALRTSDSYLVHGLDADEDNIRKARGHIRSLGLCGEVSVEQCQGSRLPYIDNLVNLVVAEELGKVSMDEVMRVLCPNGLAYIKRDGKWTRTVKPWPKEIDEWTHFLHGPDNNAVAQDGVVGSPYHIQWIGSPQHSRDHELATSMDVMVSAGGRIFYIIDEGPTAIPHWLPSRWYLVARDAFNGVVLWKRPLSNWRPYLVSGRKSLAADLWRRLVATENEVYVTKTVFGPVIALEPGTGRPLRTYKGTEKTEEIIYENGILYLVASTSEPEEIDRRRLAKMRVEPDKKRIMAVRADTCNILWAKEDEDTRGVHPLTLAAKDRRLLFQNTREVICLESDTGNVIWRYSRPSKYSRPGYATPTLVVCDDVVLSADRVNKQAARKKGVGKANSGGSELIALSAKTGNELWRCECGENVGAGADIFVVNGLVWVGENPRRGASDYNHGRELHTGEIKKRFSHEENWPTWHHHRCYRDKATKKYILAGRTGIEFVDLDSGELTTHHWVRGICEYGIMPCNEIVVFGCKDGWVYALRVSDGELIWRFRAAPKDFRLVEDDQVASVWPVHGSVLIDKGSVYFAAGRSSYLDGGIYLYKLELERGKTLLEKHYYSRDVETGKRISLYTPYDGEVLPDRELPGLLPDVLSWEGKNLYMRAVPLSRDLVIQDKEYVPHLFSSMGYLEDTWWERSYWIYGVHFYSGARGHAYARTLFPAGRILTFDEEFVYGYQDLTLNEKRPGIFCVAKKPEFIDLTSRIKPSDKKRESKSKARQKDWDRTDAARKYVWKNGVPQNPKEMNLIRSRDGLGDAIRKIVKYEYTWQKDVPLYVQAMVLTDKTFFIAGPTRFNEQETGQYLATSRTDSFQLNPFLKDALDTFEGRKGGVLLATDKTTGQKLDELELPSSPVFDGMIAANARLYVSLKNGTVLCMGKNK